MLRIRLFRVGKKNQPAYKVVVTDRRKPPRAGRFVEQVGFYNPITKEKILKSERLTAQRGPPSASTMQIP